MAKVKIQGNASGAGVFTITPPATATDRTLTLPDSTDTLATETQFKAAGGRKNLIINGGFDVWQRGTTDSYSTSGSYRSADRVYVNASTASCKLYQGVFTSSQTAVAGNPTYYGRLDVQTGDDNCGLQLRLENKDLFANRDFTLSFWSKSDAPKLLNVTIQGYGSTTSVSSTAQTFTATSSWVRYSFTFTLGSTSAVAGSTAYSRIAINQGADDTTTAWKLDIANIQLELGSVATDFEQRSYGEELALCQRYYEKSYSDGTYAGENTGIAKGFFGDGGANGNTTTGEVAIGTLVFTVPKRTTPTLTFYDHIGNSNRCSRLNAGVAWYSNSTVGYGGTLSNVGTPLVSGTGSAASGAFVHFTADAEL